MNARLDEVTIFESVRMRLMVSFAAVSLFIAALGQYAVATFTMRRRKRDFGVRLALGASAHRIQGRVIREAFALALPGLLFGFALSVTVATAFRTVLFGVTPVDPPTYAGVFLALAITSVLASYLPARRAGRVNILDTLRQNSDPGAAVMRRLRWFRSRRRGEDLTDEIEVHLAMATRDYISRGLPPDQARERGACANSATSIVQQNTREMWTWPTLEQLVEDAHGRA